jgi:hypothetical protein
MKEGFNCLLGLHLWNAGLISDAIDYVQFNHDSGASFLHSVEECWAVKAGEDDRKGLGDCQGLACSKRH